MVNFLRVIKLISLAQLLLLLLGICFLVQSDNPEEIFLPLVVLVLAASCSFALFRLAAQNVGQPDRVPTEASEAPSTAVEEASLPEIKEESGTAPDGVSDNVAGAASPAEQNVHTVLVAEDNEINQAILEEVLVQMGVKVVLASNGQEAVDTVKEWKISLVVMDIEMPVMDGMEATRIIRGMGLTPRNLPILAMTGNTDASARMDGMSLGMNDYLTKPVNPAELQEALNRWLPGGLPQTDGQAASGQTQQASGRNVIINMDAGIAATGGNKKLYNNLLERFVDHYGHGLSRLRELLQEQDYVGASRLAHTIKGVAANLGMKRIAELTKTMEASLPDVPPSELLLAEYEVAMGETLEYIASLNLNQIEAVVGDKPLEEASRQALLDLLVDLPKRTETDWGGTQRSLTEFIGPTHGTPHAALLVALLRAVNDFDLTDMASRGEQLRQSLEEASGQAA